MVAGMLLVAYYFLAFLLEEDLFCALWAGGVRLVWRESRLLSGEFLLLYYPVLVYVFGFWMPAAGEDLRLECWRLPACQKHLRGAGWLPQITGLGATPNFVDLADIQWRDFRGSLHLLVAAAAGLAALVRLGTPYASRLGADGARAGVLLRLLVGLGFLAFIHGAGALFPLALALGFCLAARAAAGTRAAVPLVWLMALAAIAAKEPNWPVRRHLTFETLAGPRWAFLDGKAFQGEYDWAESVNLIVLRLVSFGLDCHRATQGDRKADEGKGAPPSRRYAVENCFSHALYAPLFLAGPTIRFDSYLEQCEVSKRSKTPMAWYLLSVAGGLLAMETLMHMYPCFALARSGAFLLLGPRLTAAAVFLTLNLIGLKFLLLWRIARAWALLDGIDPPENMRRALCNHYSVMSFWKAWHASFNRWLVAYIYVPAGGKTRRIPATALTFLFVALWHDVEAKLLAWGGLNALFIALEVSAAAALRPRVDALLAGGRPWLHRQLCALGGTSCIFLLMAVNMIGYSVGLAGASSSAQSAASSAWEAVGVFCGGYVFFFSGVQVMFELRHLDGTEPRPEWHEKRE